MPRNASPRPVWLDTSSMLPVRNLQAKWTVVLSCISLGIEHLLRHTALTT
jgi:hypothetical protein